MLNIIDAGRHLCFFLTLKMFPTYLALLISPLSFEFTAEITRSTTLSTCLDLQLCFQGCVDLRVKHIWTTVCPRDRLYVGGAKANKYTPHIFWILPVHLYRARQTLIIFLYPNVSTFYLFLFPIVCFLIYSSHPQYSCLQKESDKSFVCCKEQKSL